MLAAVCHGFVAPNTGCGHCAQCVSGNNNLCTDYQAIGITIDGAFAEYMRIPAAAIQQGNLMPIRKEIDPAVAALIEPFACVVRGQNALHIQPGEGVLIMGAGPIGIMHLLLACLEGGQGQVGFACKIRDRLAQLALTEDFDRMTDGKIAQLLARPVHG